MWLPSHIALFISPLLLSVCVSKTYNVLDYGAHGDGKNDDTTAIQKMFNAMKSDGADGLVGVFPSGTYLCYPITFGDLDHATLQFNKGAKLVGQPDKSKWPTMKVKEAESRVTGGSYAKYQPWITINNCKYLEIAGGTFDGNGKYWWTHTPNKEEDNPRPYMMSLDSMKSLSLHDFDLINSPHIHLHISKSDTVHVFGLKLKTDLVGNNTDGIGFSDTDNVHVDNVNIQNGDDCIHFSKTCSNATVENSQLSGGHGCSIGGGTDTIGVSQILFRNITFENMSFGARLKMTKKTKGFVKDITWTDLTMTDVSRPLYIDTGYHSLQRSPNASSTNVDIGTLNFFNIEAKSSNSSSSSSSSFSNFGHGGGGKIKQPGAFICSSTNPCKKVNLKNVKIYTTEKWDCEQMNLNQHDSVTPSLPSSCT